MRPKDDGKNPTGYRPRGRGRRSPDLCPCTTRTRTRPTLKRHPGSGRDEVEDQTPRRGLFSTGHDFDLSGSVRPYRPVGRGSGGPTVGGSSSQESDPDPGVGDVLGTGPAHVEAHTDVPDESTPGHTTRFWSTRPSRSRSSRPCVDWWVRGSNGAPERVGPAGEADTEARPGDADRPVIMESDVDRGSVPSPA